MKTLRSTYLFALTAAFGVLAPMASADTYVLPFTDLVDGYMPGGTDIATLTIEDWGTDLVKITLAHNSTSTAGQFISDLWFNLDPFVAITQGNQTCNDGSAVEFDTFGAALDGHSNVGIQFDIHQTFKTSGDERLFPGEWISFTLTGSGLNAADFLAFGQPTNGGWDNVIAMIHIQGVGEGGLNSGNFAVVPEPGSLAVVGLGLAALLRRRRFR